MKTTTYKKSNLKWFVFRYDFNKSKIVEFNIFDHSRFDKDVSDLLKKCEDKTDFAEKVRRELQYNFWCKCEYEVIISGWPPREGTDRKVDIYTQVMLNFDNFIDYVWSHKKIRKKRETKGNT